MARPERWGNSVSLNGSATFSSSGGSGGSLTFDGTLLTPPATFNVAGSSSLTVNNTTTINDAITGSANLAVGAGSGTLVLGGTVANAFTGGTTINSGAVVQIANPNALQNSVVTLNTPTGLTFLSGIGNVALGGLSGSANLTMTDLGTNAVALTLGNSAGNNASYSQSLSGTTLTKVGTDTQTLLGNNTLTGIAVSGGTLSVGAVSPGINPLGSALVTLSGGTLSLQGSSYANNVAVPTASSSTINLASGVLAETLGDLSIGGSTLNVTSSDTSGSPYSLSFSNATNTTTLTGNPTFNLVNSTGGGAATLNVGSLADGGTYGTDGYLQRHRNRQSEFCGNEFDHGHQSRRSPFG